MGGTPCGYISVLKRGNLWNWLKATSTDYGMTKCLVQLNAISHIKQLQNTKSYYNETGNHIIGMTNKDNDKTKINTAYIKDTFS